MGFTLYNSEIEALKFPVGVTPLDFFISSIEKERLEEEIKGIPGLVDYGFNYKTREGTLTFWLEHFHGEHDYMLLENEFMSFLDSTPYFYVGRNALPSRVIKITVDASYKVERIESSKWAQVEVPVKIIGLPFWRTKYTTQDIDTLGYTAMADTFGSADSINIDYPKYTFTENKFKVWNGGNVTLDPRNMPLKIKLKHLVTDGKFKLTNKTTGETFEYYTPRTGNTVDLDGVQAFVGYEANRLRQTNRKYISIVPGINEIEYSGGTMDDIEFDFPFYFK